MMSLFARLLGRSEEKRSAAQIIQQSLKHVARGKSAGGGLVERVYLLRTVFDSQGSVQSEFWKIPYGENGEKTLVTEDAKYLSLGQYEKVLAALQRGLSQADLDQIRGCPNYRDIGGRFLYWVRDKDSGKLKFKQGIGPIEEIISED